MGIVIGIDVGISTTKIVGIVEQGKVLSPIRIKATDPVTSARTETGKWIYGFIVGAMAIIVRVKNQGYPEGMMLAIFFGNMIAPLIDYCVVECNISKRAKRSKVSE